MHLSCRFLYVLTFLILLTGSFVSHVYGELPPIAVPLLEAPINATWAANGAEQWRDKGFRGFIFEGILDDLRLLPSERELIGTSASPTSEDNTRAAESAPSFSLLDDANSFEQPAFNDWAALVDEIRGAGNRLKAAGIDRNFMRVQIAPEESWFSSSALADLATARFRLAGDFCQAAALSGVAIDTQSQSLIYDYRWDGYPPNSSPQELNEQARRFGARIIRAFIRACPQGEVLLLGGNPETAGPLWFYFIEGACSAMGGADNLPVQVVLPYPENMITQPFPGNQPRRFTLLREPTRFPESKNYNCRIAFSLEPIQYETDIPTAQYSLDDYRRALWTVAIHSHRYFVIRAPLGGWWQIPPDIVEQFSHLKQGNAAKVRFAPPVPRTLDLYAPRLPDSLAPLGVHADPRFHANVFLADNAAAVLYWEGSENEMETQLRTQVVHITDLLRDERRALAPRDERLILPPLPEMTLVEGLPLREHGLPASFSLDIQPALQAGIVNAQATIGVYNPLPVPLRGVLTLETDSRLALGAPVFNLRLPPGKTAAYTRTLRGLSSLGIRHEFVIQIAAAGNTPIRRSFILSTVPEERFRFFMDAAPLGTCSVDVPTENSNLLFFNDLRGRLTCFDLQRNTVAWTKRFSGRYALPPVLLMHRRHGALIAVASEQGRAHILDAGGATRLTLLREAGSIVGMSAVFRQYPQEDDLFAVHDGAVFSIYSLSGDLVQRIKPQRTLRYIATHTAFSDIVFTVQGHVSTPSTAADHEATGDEAVALNGDGAELWRQDLHSGAACPPLVLHGKTEETGLLCLGEQTGGIICLDSETGAVACRFSPASAPAPVILLTGAYVAALDEFRLFWLMEDMLHSLTLKPTETGDYAQQHWRLPVSCPTALRPNPYGEGVTIGTAFGSLYSLNAQGALLWEDHQGTGSIQVLTYVADPLVANGYLCISGTSDHLVRGLSIREDLMPSTPIRLDRLAPPRP